MTNEERADAWSKMTKSQRLAFLRQGAKLTTSSAQRMTAVAAAKRNAGGA